MATTKARSASTSDRIRSDIASAADTAMERGEDFVSEADAKARELTENAVKEITALVSSLNERLKTLGVDAGTMVEGAKDTATSIEKRLAEEVATRPLRSLFIAAAIGLGLGFLSRK
jgi:ElaB/YqjD/DUF883 family membrane-anchored ribosome-binding protein